MHTKYSMKVEINKVRISFINKSDYAGDCKAFG
jgi:hypothetical protein